MYRSRFAEFKQLKFYSTKSTEETRLLIFTENHQILIKINSIKLNLSKLDDLLIKIEKLSKTFNFELTNKQTIKDLYNQTIQQISLINNQINSILFTKDDKIVIENLKKLYFLILSKKLTKFTNLQSNLQENSKFDLLENTDNLMDYDTKSAFNNLIINNQIHMERENLVESNLKINNIVDSVNELNLLFKQLNSVVIDQGSILDNIQ